jgi:hypothetical protein
MGQRKVGMLRDKALERGHRFGKFPLIFQGFRGSIPVFAIRHGRNLLGENDSRPQCSDFPQSGEQGEERGYLPSSSN